MYIDIVHGAYLPTNYYADNTSRNAILLNCRFDDFPNRALNEPNEWDCFLSLCLSLVLAFVRFRVSTSIRPQSSSFNLFEKHSFSFNSVSVFFIFNMNKV